MRGQSDPWRRAKILATDGGLQRRQTHNAVGDDLGFRGFQSGDATENAIDRVRLACRSRVAGVGTAQRTRGVGGGGHTGSRARTKSRRSSGAVALQCGATCWGRTFGESAGTFRRRADTYIERTNIRAH